MRDKNYTYIVGVMWPLELSLETFQKWQIMLENVSVSTVQNIVNNCIVLLSNLLPIFVVIEII